MREKVGEKVLEMATQTFWKTKNRNKWKDDENAIDPKSDRNESSPTHVEWSLKINQTIVKVVFGRLLKRDEIVEVLKKSLPFHIKI